MCDKHFELGIGLDVLEPCKHLVYSMWTQANSIVYSQCFRCNSNMRENSLFLLASARALCLLTALAHVARIFLHVNVVDVDIGLSHMRQTLDLHPR